MWFKLEISNNESLIGLIGLDGKVYWRAFNVALIMGYKSPSGFAKTFATRRTVSQVVPSGICTYPKQIILTFEEMLHLVSTRGVKKNPLMADKITAVWRNGLVKVNHVSFDPNPNKATEMWLSDDGVPVQRAVIDLTEKVMEHYQRIHSFSSTDDVSSVHLEVRWSRREMVVTTSDGRQFVVSTPAVVVKEEENVEKIPNIFNSSGQSQ